MNLSFRRCLALLVPAIVRLDPLETTTYSRYLARVASLAATQTLIELVTAALIILCLNPFSLRSNPHLGLCFLTSDDLVDFKQILHFAVKGRRILSCRAYICLRTVSAPFATCSANSGLSHTKQVHPLFSWAIAI